MKEYIDKLHSIISDARISINEECEKTVKTASSDEEKEKIKLAASYFDVMLSHMLVYRREIEESILSKVQFSNQTGSKVVLDEEPIGNIGSSSYAYEGEVGAFVTDNDPFIIETKSGKKIVLDEDPEFYITSSGKKIVLDEDPEFKGIRNGNKIVSDEDPDFSGLKLGRKIVLDEDPVSITTRTGVRIFLDEDPVKNSVVSNKVIILSEDPVFKIGKTGNKIKLDEDPEFSGIDIDDEDKIDEDILERLRMFDNNIKNNTSFSFLRDFKDEEEEKKGKVITLSEDPVFNIHKNGNSFELSEEKVESVPVGNKIVLDEDPVSIKLDVDNN